MELALISGWASKLCPRTLCFCQHLDTPSQLSAFILLSKVLTSAQGKSQDRKRRVLIGRRDEGRAVGNEYVLHVMHLVELVQHRCLWIVAHAGCAQFVNDPSGSRHLAAGGNYFRPGSA